MGVCGLASFLRSLFEAIWHVRSLNSGWLFCAQSCDCFCLSVIFTVNMCVWDDGADAGGGGGQLLNSGGQMNIQIQAL
jgi:hypothetical protein